MPDIIKSGEHLKRRFTPEDTIEDLDAYIQSCAQEEHLYGYGFSAEKRSAFKHIGSMDMYDMDDFLGNLKEYSNLDGLVNPWGLAGGSGSISGIHLEDNSKPISVYQL